MHRRDPLAGVLVGADSENLSSRAVLERNGFNLVAVRHVATEDTDDPIAIYRLAPPTIRLATTNDARAVGELLDQFNHEYDEPTPGPEFLATRIRVLLQGGTAMFSSLVSRPRASPSSATDRPSGAAGSECYFAELYISLGHCFQQVNTHPGTAAAALPACTFSGGQAERGWSGGLTSRLR